MLPTKLDMMLAPTCYIGEQMWRQKAIDSAQINQSINQYSFIKACQNAGRGNGLAIMSNCRLLTKLAYVCRTYRQRNDYYIM